MSGTESETQEQPEAPQMMVDYEAECPSITGRSTLRFEAGRRSSDDQHALYLRIAHNSGRGIHSKAWAPVEQIDAIIAQAENVTARTFDELHPGKSINTGGFILAVVKDLGVVQPKEDNTRHHEHVPGTSVLQALSKRISEAKDAGDAPKPRRKGKAE